MALEDTPNETARSSEPNGTQHKGARVYECHLWRRGLFGLADWNATCGAISAETFRAGPIRSLDVSQCDGQQRWNHLWELWRCSHQVCWGVPREEGLARCYTHCA